VFDGVIRPNPTQPGRLDAYFAPPFISNHASFIEYVQGTGSLIAGWFSGTGEGQSGVSIVKSVLPPNGTQWPNATVISQKIGYSNQNPVFYCNSSNEVYAFHTSQPAVGGEDNSTFWTLKSTDGGATFSAPQLLFPQNGIWDRNRIIPSLSNDWLYPMYYSAPGTDSSFLFIKPASLPVTQNSFINIALPNTSYLIQPTIVRLFPGQPFLRAYYRDEQQKNIFTAVSLDDGKSWTDAEPTVLPNNNSGINAYTLLSGNIALIYNPMTSGRNILAISLSLDHGVTWKYTRLLVNQTSGEYSYPSMLQTADGNIHITYTYLRETIQYTQITESWIQQGN